MIFVSLKFLIEKIKWNLCCSFWRAAPTSSSFSSLCHKISRQRSQETALIMEQLRWWIRFSISVGGPCNHACSKGSHWTRHCTKILEMENGQQVKELNHTSLLCKWKLAMPMHYLWHLYKVIIKWISSESCQKGRPICGIQ